MGVIHLVCGDLCNLKQHLLMPVLFCYGRNPLPRKPRDGIPAESCSCPVLVLRVTGVDGLVTCWWHHQAQDTVCFVPALLARRRELVADSRKMARRASARDGRRHKKAEIRFEVDNLEEVYNLSKEIVILADVGQKIMGAELSQARAEQEEEFISNTLFKKIQALQKEKETLAVNYEKEEEFLTNELSRKLMQLQHEKAELEQHLEQEQEFQVNKLMKKIKKLENDTISKQLTLEQLRREKIDLENTLEQEQEALVNRLWKRMDKLEAEKRILQEKLDQPVSAPPSPRDISMEIDSPENMMRHIRFLKNEVERLKKQLRAAQLQHSEKMAQYLEEERHMREENLRLQRKLQREMERREALCRQLSESESSLEMDDERYFNEMSAQGLRPRTVSSPIPYTPSPSSSRPISPGLSYASHTVGFTPPTSLTRAGMSYYNSPGLHVQHMGPSHGITRPSPRRSNSPDKFKRPTPPPSPNTQSPVQPPPPPPPPPVQPTAPSAASQAATFQHSVHPSSQP
ncbi:PREDICTED: coiled-coil domain-containing protein 6 [Chaetura pelagica]|uniref:coiled-coil domain-containing protein 6 n=1 Tax=Chaetura pelagica TaxID=8897 RepID=UPI000523EC0C|nr:PREDICTED: coiled-coil domain-containing protein 6 [Chaetura pelagica]